MEASSPATLAGLQPHSDYIVGADQVLQDVRLIFIIICIIGTANTHVVPKFDHVEPYWNMSK